MGQLALEKEQYELASELLRFVVPPGDNDGLWSGGHEALGGAVNAALLHKPASQMQRQGVRCSTCTCTECVDNLSCKCHGFQFCLRPVL